MRISMRRVPAFFERAIVYDSFPGCRVRRDNCQIVTGSAYALWSHCDTERQRCPSTAHFRPLRQI